MNVWLYIAIVLVSLGLCATSVMQLRAHKRHKGEPPWYGGRPGH